MSAEITSTLVGASERIFPDYFKGKNIKALVAEDNLVNRKVMKGILTKIGIDVELAENGREALNLIEKNHFNIVFMDC